MEMSLPKKIFTSLFYILLAFILLYIFSIWSSVFILRGWTERLQYVNQQGQTLQNPVTSEQIFSLGVHQGDIEIALYSTAVVILISIIPFLWGLFMYWRTGEKVRVMRKVIIGLIIFQFVGFLLMWLTTFQRSLYFFPLSLGYPLQYFSVFFTRFFPMLIVAAILLYAVYWILFLILDKKFSISTAVFILGIILLVFSLNYSAKAYVYSGCNDFQDQYCINTLAIDKSDPSICEKTVNQFYKDICINGYAENKYDPSVCSKLDHSTSSGNDKVSPQTQCIVSLNGIINALPTKFFSRPHFVTLEEKSKNCDVLDDSSERDFCKKVAQCIYQRYSNSQNIYDAQNIEVNYNGCVTEAQQLLERK